MGRAWAAKLRVGCEGQGPVRSPCPVGCEGQGPVCSPSPGRRPGEFWHARTHVVGPTGQSFPERLARWAEWCMESHLLPRAMPWAGRSVPLRGSQNAIENLLHARLRPNRVLGNGPRVDGLQSIFARRFSSGSIRRTAKWILANRGGCLVRKDFGRTCTTAPLIWWGILQS